MKVSPNGWVVAARHIRSPNQDARPPATSISLAVLHCISLPPGRYGGDAIERLFCNRLDPRAHPYFRAIASMKVSAHFLVRRNGALLQFVPVHRRAWHAGASRWRGRSRCNDFSIGIELEGSEGASFSEAQYRTLQRLLASLRRALPLRDIAAHSEVAPGRKSDPGTGFDWARLHRLLAAR